MNGMNEVSEVARTYVLFLLACFALGYVIAKIEQWWKRRRKK